MIAGRVDNFHASLPVPLRMPDGTTLIIEFVVDTGFVGFLTLPKEAVKALNLLYLQDTAHRRKSC